MTTFKGNYINSNWIQPKNPTNHYTRFSPAELSTQTFSLSWNLSSVCDAVNAANNALNQWRKLDKNKRIEYIYRLRDAFKASRESIAHAISLETGKPYWETLTEADALVAKIDIMTTEGLEQTATVFPTQLINGRYQYRPLGVIAVIAPFNFPVHLANGHIIPALLTGNTVVVKPSLFTSLSMQVYFDCIAEAGFPTGVINLVYGDGEVGAALVSHKKVSGVLFTGSYKTGVAIRRATVETPGKLVALEMGGKNTTIVFPDANLDQATYEIALASFLSTGQRCSATSRVALHREIADEMIDRLADIVDHLSIGHPLNEDPFCGPLTTQEAYDNFLNIQENNDNGALSMIRQGKKVREDLNGYYVSPGLWMIHEVTQGVHQHEEIFGPDICFYKFDDDQDAISFANGTDYGLAMSIFTSDEERFNSLAYDLETGILNLNRSTCGASSRLPFGGVKNSGNHRASAILAGLYCTYPQSQIRNKSEWNSASLENGPLAKMTNSPEKKS